MWGPDTCLLIQSAGLLQPGSYRAVKLYACRCNVHFLRCTDSFERGLKKKFRMWIVPDGLDQLVVSNNNKFTAVNIQMKMVTAQIMAKACRSISGNFYSVADST